MRVACLIALMLLFAGMVRAETAREYCARVGNDDTLQALPRALVPQAVRLFGLQRMPEQQVLRGTVIRCMDHAVWACNHGANLPCGKANTRDTLPVEGAGWCRKFPNANFVPAYISGHDSVYRWRCRDGKPVASGPLARTDARGFLTRYWKRVG